MEPDPRTLIEQLFSRMMARDREGMLDLFTDDATVYDPHYPIPMMVGKDAIEQGLRWGLANIAEPGFSIQKVWLQDGDGVAETHTFHTLKGGIKLDFEQVFFFECRAGKITRLRAFVPYPPPGIGGWIAWLTGLWWRLSGKGA